MRDKEHTPEFTRIWSKTTKLQFVYHCRGCNDISQKFAMQWRRRVRPHKGYIYIHYIFPKTSQEKSI